jgi:hypothetical protein
MYGKCAPVQYYMELVQETDIDCLMNYLQMRLLANPNLSAHTPQEILGSIEYRFRGFFLIFFTPVRDVPVLICRAGHSLLFPLFVIRFSAT